MVKQPVRKVSNSHDSTERLLERVTIPIAILAIVYIVLAYIIFPAIWTHHERQPQLAQRTMLTATRQDIPGDPINVGFVGDREDIIRAMHEAGWFAANDVTWRSSVAIIGSVLLDRPYQAAPVSPLYYEGKPEDLAFELPDGVSAHRRHHVRIWRVLDVGLEGRPIWLGASTYDRSVGLSHYTGQVTHHIAPQIDQERDFLIGQLKEAGMVERGYSVTGVGPTLISRNGEGDLYQTDGEIWIAQLVVKGNKRTEPPVILDPPTLVQEKNRIWNALMGVVGQ
jgi:LssY C-terminus